MIQSTELVTVSMCIHGYQDGDEETKNDWSVSMNLGEGNLPWILPKAFLSSIRSTVLWNKSKLASGWPEATPTW